MKFDSQVCIRFGEWRAYPGRNLLEGPAGRIHLEPKMMQVLACLANHAGDVVRYDDLLSDVWQGRVFSNEPLKRIIFELRRHLDDSVADPEYIQTVPKSGYRFVCAVDITGGASDGSRPATGNLSTDRSNIFRPGVLRGVLAIAIGLSVVFVSVMLVRSYSGETPAPLDVTVEGSPVSSVSRHSIAVLPFRNRSDASEDAYFVDGVHEDIVVRLAKLPALQKVISSTSVERYRGASVPVQQIGRELAVANVLQGSVQRAGNKVRIRVQLIDAVNDTHLWAESFDRQLTTENLFAIQREISRQVARSLNLVISAEAISRLDPSQTTSLDAYGEYVRGRLELAARNAASLQRAQAHFSRAVGIDPDYGLAYVGLADSYALRARYADLDLADSFAPRQEAIDTALALAPRSGEAYLSLAWLLIDQDRIDDSEPYFLKALELSPNHSTAYQLFSQFLRIQGRYDEALEAARKAVSLDPMEPMNSVALADILHSLARHAEVLDMIRGALARNPDFPRLYLQMAEVLNHLGRHGEAALWLRTGVQHAPAASILMSSECYQYVILDLARLAEQCFTGLAGTFPDLAPTWARVDYHGSRSEYPQAVAVAEELVRRNPNISNKHYLAWSYLDNEELDKAYGVWREIAPQFFGNGAVAVTLQNIEMAVFAGHTLHRNGNIDRADYLFEQALEFIRNNPPTRRDNYEIANILIHVTRGDEKNAIAALRHALDMGFYNRFWLRSPIYRELRDVPEWNALQNELAEYIAQERHWFEEHENDDLLGRAQ